MGIFLFTVSLTKLQKAKTTLDLHLKVDLLGDFFTQTSASRDCRSDLTVGLRVIENFPGSVTQHPSPTLNPLQIIKQCTNSQDDPYYQLSIQHIIHMIQTWSSIHTSCPIHVSSERKKQSNRHFVIIGWSYKLSISS